MSRGKVTIVREYDTRGDDSRDTISEPFQTKLTTRTRTTTDEKPLKINVIRESSGTPGSNRQIVTSHGGDGAPPASFTEMQAKMEEELEKRRLDWEKDVMKMQADFFKMPGGSAAITDGRKPGESGGESSTQTQTQSGTVPVTQTRIPSVTGSEILDISNTKNLYHYKPDGSKVYRLRFNVKDFKPNEISVKAEGKKIMVTAKHEEEKDSGQKTSKNFNRQMDIPAGVMAEDMVAELSSDGILSIEAPVDEEEAEKAKQFIPGMEPTGNFDQIESYSVGDPFKAIQGVIPGFTPHYSEQEAIGGPPGLSGYEVSHTFHSPTCHHPSRPKMHHAGVLGRISSPHIERVNDFAQKVKLEVDVGSEYTPDDVTVELAGNQIHVRAKHEEKTSSGRTAKREYSRSFDIPEKVDPRSLRAVLGSDGFLTVAASLASNQDKRAAFESIKKDMSQGGIPVNIAV